MSFLKKGLLANYITDYVDGDPAKPRFKEVSTEKKGFRKTTKKARVWYVDESLSEKTCHFSFTSSKSQNYSLFKFSLPPQGIEITYPQRIYETKTFGGSIIEDYGNDTVNILVQGSTVNSEIRSFTYGSSKKNGTGFEEITAFQNEVQKFGVVEDKQYSDKIKFTYEGFDFWVYIKELTIKQSKDNPLAYIYTISMLGVNKADFKIKELGNLKFTFKDRLAGLLNKFNDFVDMIESYLAILEVGLAVFEAFMDICATIRAVVERLEKAINNLVNQLLAYVDGVTTCFNEFTSLADYVVTTGIRVSLGTVDKALNSVKALVEAIDGAVKFFEDFSDKYGKMSDDIIEHWEKTSDEIVETCKYMSVSSKEKAEALQAEIQHTVSSCDVAVIPGDKNTDDEISFVYGIKEYTLTSNDNWESLAVKFYGDVTKASLLNSFNNQKLAAQNHQNSETEETSENEVGAMPSAGTTIYIPVLESGGGFDGTNEVYNQPDVVDNYGKDIEIGADGDFSFHNGDFDTTENSETLMQAVINRLSTTVGTRLRDTVYGIRTNIGDTDNMIQTVISSSIEDTLLDDPRIKSVDNIEFKGNGDNLAILVEFTDINDTQHSIGGTF